MTLSPQLVVGLIPTTATEVNDPKNEVVGVNIYD